VALPLISEPFSEQTHSDQPISIREDARENTGDPETEEAESLPVAEKKTASVLFIEDNPDMRKFVRSFLEHEFGFFEAENGEKGLSLARERIPDIIISDIMMPGIDGVEVVRILKSDRRTCHIPIILLTAKAAKEDKIDALRMGADDFIVKPFDMQELKYRIRNQLHQMERLRERNIKTFLIRDFRPSVFSHDDVFLAELTDAVYRNLDNSGFNVAELSREMGISRTQLFRKLKALTGKQPSDFIRCLRLKKAVELMLDGSSNLSEIAYDTGFNSISYFSRRFKEFYHVSPSEYIKDLPRRKDTGLSAY